MVLSWSAMKDGGGRGGDHMIQLSVLCHWQLETIPLSPPLWCFGLHFPSRSSMRTREGPVVSKL